MPMRVRNKNDVDEWASVKVHPTPELNPVTSGSQDDGLLVLDFVKACGPSPRGVASLSAESKNLSEGLFRAE